MTASPTPPDPTWWRTTPRDVPGVGVVVVTSPAYDTDGRYGYAEMGSVYRVLHLPSGEPQLDYFSELDAKAKVLALERSPHVWPDDMSPTLVETMAAHGWFACPECARLLRSADDGMDDDPRCDDCWAEAKDPIPW